MASIAFNWIVEAYKLKGYWLIVKAEHPIITLLAYQLVYFADISA
jgi:hypothetical protein